MQWQSIDVDRSDTHSQESVGVVIFLKRLQYDCRRRRDQGLKVGGNGNGMSLPIVDCEPCQMFTVGELLNGALQRTLCVPLQIAFHTACQTLTQNLGTPPQFLLEGTVQHQNRIIGGTKRPQRDAKNQRDDQSSAQQSHLTRPPKPATQRAVQPQQTSGARCCSRIPTDQARALRHCAARSRRSEAKKSEYWRHPPPPERPRHETMAQAGSIQEDANVPGHRFASQATSILLRTGTAKRLHKPYQT